jgi:hypothetical protein
MSNLKYLVPTPHPSFMPASPVRGIRVVCSLLICVPMVSKLAELTAAAPPAVRKACGFPAKIAPLAILAEREGSAFALSKNRFGPTPALRKGGALPRSRRQSRRFYSRT